MAAASDIVSSLSLTYSMPAHTFKARSFGNMERSMLPRDSVFRETASSRPHLVEGTHTVSGLEFPDIGTNRVHDACDVVAGVVGLVHEDGDFPAYGC